MSSRPPPEFRRGHRTPCNEVAPSIATVMARKGKEPARSEPLAHEAPTTLSSEPPSSPPDSASVSSGRTLADRRAAFEQLKLAKGRAGRANAKALAASESGKKKAGPGRVSEHKARKLEAARNELDRLEAEARGDDAERLAHWNYSVEETERWNAKMEAKSATQDQGAVDHGTAAERAYARKVRALPAQAKSSELQNTVESGPPQEEGYGSHAPSNDAVDAVVEHMNSEAVTRANRSRKRAADPEAEVTYINERNRQFNDRVSRFYDRYTKEIRDNLERGTAL